MGGVCEEGGEKVGVSKEVRRGRSRFVQCPAA